MPPEYAAKFLHLHKWIPLSDAVLCTARSTSCGYRINTPLLRSASICSANTAPGRAAPTPQRPNGNAPGETNLTLIRDDRRRWRAHRIEATACKCRRALPSANKDAPRGDSRARTRAARRSEPECTYEYYEDSEHRPRAIPSAAVFDSFITQLPDAPPPENPPPPPLKPPPPPPPPKPPPKPPLLQPPNPPRDANPPPLPPSQPRMSPNTPMPMPSGSKPLSAFQVTARAAPTSPARGAVGNTTKKGARPEADEQRGKQRVGPIVGATMLAAVSGQWRRQRLAVDQFGQRVGGVVDAAVEIAGAKFPG